MWLKNTDGKQDAMLTFATVSFIAVTLNIILTTLGQVSFGGNVIEFAPLDSTAMGVYLAATFSAYVGRRLTDRHYTQPNQPPVNPGVPQLPSEPSQPQVVSKPRVSPTVPDNSLKDEFREWKRRRDEVDKKVRT